MTRLFASLIFVLLILNVAFAQNEEESASGSKRPLIVIGAENCKPSAEHFVAILAGKLPGQPIEIVKVKELPQSDAEKRELAFESAEKFLAVRVLILSFEENNLSAIVFFLERRESLSLFVETEKGEEQGGLYSLVVKVKSALAEREEKTDFQQEIKEPQHRDRAAIKEETRSSEREPSEQVKPIYVSFATQGQEQVFSVFSKGALQLFFPAGVTPLCIGGGIEYFPAGNTGLVVQSGYCVSSKDVEESSRSSLKGVASPGTINMKTFEFRGGITRRFSLATTHKMTFLDAQGGAGIGINRVLYDVSWYDETLPQEVKVNPFINLETKLEFFPWVLWEAPILQPIGFFLGISGGYALNAQKVYTPLPRREQILDTARCYGELFIGVKVNFF